MITIVIVINSTSRKICELDSVVGSQKKNLNVRVNAAVIRLLKRT